MEQTLVLIKPDGVARQKIGAIINRFEEKGFTIQGLKMTWLDKELVDKHYAEHKGKEFYNRLVDYITEWPLVAMVLAGPNVLQETRKLCGATDPIEAEPGTIRGDFGLDLEEGNLVHASDSPESAQKEIDLFFSVEEIYDY